MTAESTNSHASPRVLATMLGNKIESSSIAVTTMVGANGETRAEQSESLKQATHKPLVRLGLPNPSTDANEMQPGSLSLAPTL